MQGLFDKINEDTFLGLDFIDFAEEPAYLVVTLLEELFEGLADFNRYFERLKVTILIYMVLSDLRQYGTILELGLDQQMLHLVPVLRLVPELRFDFTYFIEVNYLFYSCTMVDLSMMMNLSTRGMHSSRIHCL